MVSKPLVNRVAQSGLITINLEEYYPDQIRYIDIKDFLFKGLILREKDFRAAIKEMRWADYTQSLLCVHCSADAIIPTWAYMLIASYASDYVAKIFVCQPTEVLNHYYRDLITEMHWNHLEDKRIVIKGCSDKQVPMAAYTYLTHKLRPIVKSIMFGEPCSTVPIYKQSTKR